MYCISRLQVWPWCAKMMLVCMKLKVCTIKKRHCEIYNRNNTDNYTTMKYKKTSKYISSCMLFNFNVSIVWVDCRSDLEMQKRWLFVWKMKVCTTKKRHCNCEIYNLKNEYTIWAIIQPWNKNVVKPVSSYVFISH